MKRGDVVLADFPFQDMPGSKVRPAVVVQNDADNQVIGYLPSALMQQVNAALKTALELP